MDYNEVIENLKYLISEDCTDTQFDYEDEIDIAIKVMESQEDLRSKINKAIEEIEELAKYEMTRFSEDVMYHKALKKCLEIIKKNIGE